MNNYRIFRPFAKGLFTKLGKRFDTNLSGFLEVIEVIDNKKVKIKFDRTGYEKVANYESLKLKAVRDNSQSTRKVLPEHTADRFCVYLHKDKENIVRYVGEGTTTRAYRKSRADQPTWQKMFLHNQPVVEIVAHGLTKEAAETLELEYIEKYKETIINSLTASKKAHTISFEHISEYVFYDESSPTFLRWKKSQGTSSINKPAGHTRKDKRYSYLELLSVNYAIHRLVWVLHHKVLSESDMIDHIDGNRQNNSISNLRLTDPKENAHNKLRGIPKSGFRNIGIHYKRDKKKVQAFIVRWHYLDSNKRHWKMFNTVDYISVYEAFVDAYTFRDTVIKSGLISHRTKEGEEPIENYKEMYE